jgi:hypothetical protein
MPNSRLPADLRRVVKSRAGNLCEYCLALGSYSFHPFSIDHIVPVSKGGSDDPDNLAYACQFCNSSKYDKTTATDSLTGATVSLFNPRSDGWPQHFTWNEDFTIILGITPTGRATIACLNMNREEAVNLRAALRSFGVHPPV